MQNALSSKILVSSENILDSFETTPSISTQMNLIEILKKVNDASIISNEKIFGKAKLDRLKAIILNSIANDVEVLIRNEIVRNKYTLSYKSRDEIYKMEINMIREELKSNDFISKDLLQTIKEIKS